MRYVKRLSIFMASLCFFLPKAHATIGYSLSNFNNNSPSQILLNQVSSACAGMIEKIEEYYSVHQQFPSANSLQQCFNPPNFINCIKNDENGGIIITFSSNADAILS